jgi:hypothetical protein
MAKTIVPISRTILPVQQQTSETNGSRGSSIQHNQFIEWDKWDLGVRVRDRGLN